MLNNKKAKRVTLNESVILNSFSLNKFNIIETPTGSGKTYASIHKIQELCSDSRKTLYLIDTSAGEENILRTYNEIEAYDNDTITSVLGTETEDIQKIAVIMTYAKLGYELLNEKLCLSDYNIIICDEMQSLVKYMKWDKERVAKNFPFSSSELQEIFLSKCSLPHIAFQGLEMLINNNEKNTYIVVLSATPEPIKKVINDFAIVKLSVDVDKYKPSYKKEYYSSEDIPYLIPKENKTLIYIPQIERMKTICAKVESLGFKCMCLWSINAKKTRMNKEQLEARKLLLTSGVLPDSIQVLFINEAYQTSINIKDESIRTAIIHTTNRDDSEQAQGRIRHDYDNLYVFKPNSKNAIINKPIPQKYIGVALTKEHKKELQEYFNIRDKKGQLRGFKYIMEHLDNRYMVETRNRKYYITFK